MTVLHAQSTQDFQLFIVVDKKPAITFLWTTDYDAVYSGQIVVAAASASLTIAQMEFFLSRHFDADVSTSLCYIQKTIPKSMVS